MPKKKATEETAKKKTNRKKSSAKKKSVLSEPVASPPQPSISKKKQSSGGSGVMLLLFIIVLAAIVGIYLVQQRQTDSVVSKLSHLEGKLAEKIDSLEENLEKAEEEIQEEVEMEDIVMDTYKSLFFGYSFSFPHEYIVAGIETSIDEHLREQVILIRAADKPMFDDAEDIVGFPRISFTVYQNIGNLPLETWARKEGWIFDSVGVEMLQQSLVDISAYVYTSEDAENATVLVKMANHVLVAEVTNERLEDAFAEILGTLSL